MSQYCNDRDEYVDLAFGNVTTLYKDRKSTGIHFYQKRHFWMPQNYIEFQQSQLWNQLYLGYGISGTFQTAALNYFWTTFAS